MKRIVCLLAILLLVSACQQQAADEVVIGFMGPLTGDVAVYGNPAQKSVQVAVEQVNEEGGINSRTVRVIYEDSKCSGKEAVNVVNKFVSVDKIDAVVGTLCSAAAIPTHQIAEQAGVVMVGYGSSSPDLTPNTPFYFRTFPSDALQAKVGAELTLSEGHERIVVFHVNDEYGTAFKNTYVRNIEEMDGAEVVAVETYTPGDVDFRSQIQKIIDAKPDMVYLIAFPKEGGLIIKQARESGLDVTFMGSEALNDKSLLDTAGNAAEGLRLTWPKGGEGQPYETYRQAYMQRFGEEPSVFGPEAYDALHLIVKSMRECGIQGSEIKQCLENMEPYEGASGTIEFDEYGDVQKEYVVYEAKNGEFVLVG